MTKRAESKYKINRRLGVNLWGRPKSPVNKRDYGPGQHGQRRKKATDYGTQLAAKQKLRSYYGNISEKQFRRYYQEAVRVRGDSSQLLIELLERRLDAVVYRMKFAITPFAARQFISHGHVQVNGKNVNISSFNVKAGDEITVKDRPKSRQLAQRNMELTQIAPVPDWLTVDRDALSGKVAHIPSREEMQPMVNEQLIVELYSR